MAMTNRVTEESLPVAYILPQAVAQSLVYSDAIPLDAIGHGRRFVADVMLGTIGSGASVTGGFYWCATSGGFYVAITGVQMTADTAGSRAHVVEVSTEQVLAFAPTAGFIKFAIVSATANTTCAVVVRGFQLSQNPVNQLTNTTCVELVTGPVSGIA